MVQNQHTYCFCLGPAAKAPVVTLCFFLAEVLHLAIVEANFMEDGESYTSAPTRLGIPMTYIHTENLLPF